MASLASSSEGRSWGWTKGRRCGDGEKDGEVEAVEGGEEETVDWGG
jgi:hypothetical protein